jgi:hypothetical protein
MGIRVLSKVTEAIELRIAGVALSWTHVPAGFCFTNIHKIFAPYISKYEALQGDLR